MSQPFKYCPITGRRPVFDQPHKYRQAMPRLKWEFNPWTGIFRDQRDIESDPVGYLLAPPSEPLEVAQ